MFSGYGGAEFALKKANIEHECIGFSEIDKYAIQCFQQNHGMIKNYGDCKNINPNDLPDFDLLTGGFPCQSFSIAGKGLGELDTRGTLFYEIIRIAEVKKPKYMLLENVKGLTFKTHKSTFDKILSELKRIGYDVIWKVLNSKDYGIPQNRERVFFVCKLGSWNLGEFKFPEKEELKIFIKDILEKEVDKKYYLSDKMQERFNKYLEDKKLKEIPKVSSPFGGYKDDNVCGTLGAGCGISASKTNYIVKDNETTNKYDTDMSKPEIGQANRVYGIKGITPPLNVGWTPKIVTRIEHQSRSSTDFKENNLSPTLMSCMGTGGNNVPMISNTSPREVGFQEVSPALLSRDYKDPKIVNQNQLRRLTPKECFRLMGFLNDEINLDNLSDTQKYKLAGNGWDINLVSKIFKEIFKFI